jgi:hypothetical protein
MSTKEVPVDRWQDLEPGDEIVAITDPHAPGQFTVRREVPEWKPGTVGTATVRGVEGVRVMRTDGTGGADYLWLSSAHIRGYRQHAATWVTDFVPDDAEAPSAEVQSARDALVTLRDGYYISPLARTFIDGFLDGTMYPSGSEVEALRAQALRPGGKARVTGESYDHVIQIGSTVTIVEPGSYPGDYWVEGPWTDTGELVKQVLHSDALEPIT